MEAAYASETSSTLLTSKRCKHRNAVLTSQNKEFVSGLDYEMGKPSFETATPKLPVWMTPHGPRLITPRTEFPDTDPLTK
jgi:hypothetical protein